MTTLCSVLCILACLFLTTITDLSLQGRLVGSPRLPTAWSADGGCSSAVRHRFNSGDVIGAAGDVIGLSAISAVRRVAISPQCFIQSLVNSQPSRDRRRKVGILLHDTYVGLMWNSGYETLPVQLTRDP